MWLDDLRDHPSIRHGVFLETVGSDDSDDGNTSDDFILKVSRPKLVNAPAPPNKITPWLRDGWQQIDGQVSVEPFIKRDDGSNVQIINFTDDPQRPILLEEWKRRGESWADADRPAHAACDIFDT